MRWTENNAKKHELHSDFDNDEGDEEGPRLDTIDDGTGGIKHMKVIKEIVK